MIVTRAPLRISFIGGGTDLPAFFKQSPGRVLSAAINKYVYVTVTKTPFSRVSARYSLAENVLHAGDLKNDRMREALLAHGIKRGVELSTFSHLPGKTGLGSSSAFSVALVKALYTLRGLSIEAKTCAEDACDLEIRRLGEPIGKQDQYAAAFGGVNVFEFRPDNTVDVEPLALDFKHRIDFERHLLLFFTGTIRDASTILAKQKENTHEAGHFATLEKMAGSVTEFKRALEEGDFPRLGAILHENWERKRSLAEGISNMLIDDLYEIGRSRGALGGKVLGAGGGGCILFLVEPKNREILLRALQVAAERHGLVDAAPIRFSFSHSGAEVIVNTRD